MTEAQDDVEQVLRALREGDLQAYDRLIPLVYTELRRLAHLQLRRFRPGQTLDTSALVHEAYLKLAGQTRLGFRGRDHFLAVASVAMRHILVSYARHRTAQKRGGDEAALTLVEGRGNSAGATDDGNAIEVLALNKALDELARLDQRLGRLVELRFFGGLKVEEAAEMLEISTRTAKRDWRKARAFLYRTLHSGPSAK